MPSCKLNMTLKRFIIFVFLTLDIGLFVQPYPLEGVCIFRCMQTAVANQRIKHGVKDGEEVMHVFTRMVSVSPNDPKMLSGVTQRDVCIPQQVLFIVLTVKHITLV